MEGFIRFFPNKIRSPPNPHLEYFFSISLLHCAVCHHFGGSCICICLCLSYLQQLSPKLHSFCFILTKLCIEIHATFHNICYFSIAFIYFRFIGDTSSWFWFPWSACKRKVSVLFSRCIFVYFFHFSLNYHATSLKKFWRLKLAKTYLRSRAEVSFRCR